MKIPKLMLIFVRTYVVCEIDLWPQQSITHVHKGLQVVHISVFMIITRRYSSANDHAIGPIYLGNANTIGSS